MPETDFDNFNDQTNRTAAAPVTKRKPTQEEAAAAVTYANQNDLNAIWDAGAGAYTYTPLNSGEQIKRSADKQAHPEWFTAGATPDPVAPDINADTLNAGMDRLNTPVTNPALTPRGPVQTRQAFGDANTVFTPRSVTGHQRTYDINDGVEAGGITGQQVTDAMGGAKPGDEAPTVDRAKIDNILGGLSGYQNKIADLAEDNTGLSVAEAQLKKATDLANLQAGIDTEASQRAALGQARSSRSRNDRGLLERQAVGEAAFVGQEAARTASLRQAEQEGNLAELRAQEADYDRRFRLEALGKAADLGLNRSALEVDISKTNLDSATNWINQQFGQLGIDKQINQQEAESMLGFTRDMAAIQLQYDQLSAQEQQQADSLLMQKYGIDQQTMVALKGIKEQGKFKWDQVLAGFVGGVATSATAAIAK